ncbi:hypothetical protein EDD18DRAFT_1206312 [Armillaria luteobubalina]|uniref:Secreted protein n=1 Tax=Armillaria luteobubalina TaxID=153913 RepID=A0AA39UF63_9AGAR|nr:hypothetical protein EDD18DRAFT_1206312 [Armillaria luteobubalina]
MYPFHAIVLVVFLAPSDVRYIGSSSSLIGVKIPIGRYRPDVNKWAALIELRPRSASYRSLHTCGWRTVSYRNAADLPSALTSAHHRSRATVLIL